MTLHASLAALLFMSAAGVQAAELTKCVDAAGKVTYSSEACEKQGLKPAGPIKERTTVLPAQSPPPDKKEAAGEERKPAATVQPINPLIQQLLK
jgi:nucleoid-associated protein YgaU